jgi:hypothetical protein
VCLLFDSPSFIPSFLPLSLSTSLSYNDAKGICRYKDIIIKETEMTKRMMMGNSICSLDSVEGKYV